MFEINWNIFKAKFNGKEQKIFENLCYLLFCNEYNQDTGIFRYKNQAGIETDPIEHKGSFIGFQSKFYETKVSDNVQDIKDSITKAKAKNPNLNKLLFYINQEFSESNKKQQKEPQYKINIEEFAAAKGIEIVWRVPSHIERQLALEVNTPLGNHFFTFEKSIFDFVEDLIQHTESILMPIHSNIEFMGNVIKLDRSAALSDLNSILVKSAIVILSGKGGVGKTALIKDFYSQLKETVPMFVFKATEFNIPNINNLFNAYGNFTLTDFISEYQQIDDKYIIIDSAEKLSDIEDQEVFQEFLSAIISSKWKIIFTTRYSYLDDLKFQLLEVYRVSFNVLNIEEIKTEELAVLSREFGFSLPQNERLLELLQSPFYLSEYLLNYENMEGSVSLSDFKNILWNKQIAKSIYKKNNIHIRRENCFLKLAQQRANEGQFFISAEGYDSDALRNLENDEIIKYEAHAGGYFITHDIYEEWALDKIIERSYSNMADFDRFFDSLGTSLPIRRAFRNWLSEKLFINQDGIKLLIENSLNNEKIDTFWKDEMIVSVLLSEYSKVFFQLFETRLLENEQELLMRIVFLLRIACKEVDDNFLTLIGLGKTNDLVFTTLFTKPKGSGWDCVINFIHKHKEIIGTKHISIILPLLADWNNKNIQGDTTKKASQIGLFYYENIVANGGFSYRFEKEKKEQLIKVILQGAAEIKEELRCIFDGVLTRSEPNHHDVDYELVEVILTSITDNFEVIKNLPDYVIKLAELFWVNKSKKNEWYMESSLGVEKYFGLSDKYDFRYSPPSAFQTPVYQLLRFAPNETINFILSFTNRAVECYAKSELKDEVEEVQVFLNDTLVINQYISNRLWNAYRGSQVSTDLLASMHMALEKWLLDYAKTNSAQHLEYLCSYLIENSRSASVTAVVASAVMSQPSKLFNIAKILFQTKEFFFYDTTRLVADQSVKSLYSIGYGLNFLDKIHQDERIKTCDDKHRKKALEHIAVEYQFFRSEEVSDEEAGARQKALWEIFDEYYKELEDNHEETKSERVWRLYLARMDRRKMNPKVEEVEEGILIDFNPEIEPELKKYSEESLKQYNNANKYMQLYLWSNYRFEGEEDKYCQYQQYEKNPQLALTEVREIMQAFNKGVSEEYQLFNRSIPAYVCTVLIRDFESELSLEEMEFCKDIIIEYSILPFKLSHYSYQVSDGSEPAINALPYLFKYFSEDKEEAEEIKSLLILLLLSIHSEISAFTTRAILLNLWDLHFKDANSIFVGYLHLKPKYNRLIDEIRIENQRQGMYEITEKQILERFVKKYGNELENIVADKINYSDIQNLQNIDLRILTTAFELLPLRTEDNDHMRFVLSIFPVFARKIFQRNRYDDETRFDYSLMIRFLEKFSCFILTAKKEIIGVLLQPFVENFKVSDNTAMFFQQLISTEDRLNQYEEFWLIWHAFYEKIAAICKTKNYYHDTKEIIYNYLLAWPYWKKTAREWHSLKDREKMFYKMVSEDMGYFPPVLYSISKVLSDIGSNFLEDGVLWISDMVGRNKNLLNEELEVNTIYYIENIVRKYILSNRQKIRTNLQMKQAVVNILNYLVERGSVTGYLLRENIL